MVGDVSDAAPYGFLRKVNDVDLSGGQVIIQTAPATLEDAIQQGSMRLSRRLTPEDIQSTTMMPGVTLMSMSGPTIEDSFFLDIDGVVLYDKDGNLSTTHDQVQADGSPEFAPDFDLSWAIEDRTLQELEFVFNVTETAELEFLVEVDVLTLEASYLLTTLNLGTITVFVGPVPVVFLIQMPVYLRADGEVSVGITTSVTQEATVSASLRYEDGDWDPISSLSNDFDFELPSAFAKAKLKGYVDPPLSLLLYGVAGPHAGVDPYLELKVEPLDDPWLTLSAGLEAKVGVVVTVLGRSLADYSAVVIGYEIVLLELVRNEPPYTPADPVPSDEATGQSRNVDLSWVGGDPDGDAVSYDVYLEAGDITPDMLVSNDQSGVTFDPGTLAESTHYYWQIVAADDKGEISEGPVWDFTTGSGSNNPPNVPANPAPADGATGISATPSLSWTGGDPDGDTVTYDAYFEVDDATPDVLVSNDQSGTTFNPGALEKNTHYYWKIIATDEHSAASAGAVWDFKTRDGGVGPGEMVNVPAGEFQMGCDPAHNGDYSCYFNELPLHAVYLDAYDIDATEVTNVQYAQCVADGACDPPASFASSTRASYYDDATYGGYPVIYVDWQRATDFCTWAGKRLPTEAEWEKAARGTTVRVYPWGDQNPDCTLANSFNNATGSNCEGDTSQVGGYPDGASPYGALDMSGNVWEWVNDWYGADYYDVSPYSNPTGPVRGSYKVLRGGSWYLDWSFLRATDRSFYDPTFTVSTLGFRCASSPGG